MFVGQGPEASRNRLTYPNLGRYDEKFNPLAGNGAPHAATAGN
jgi:hypothetical protein